MFLTVFILWIILNGRVTPELVILGLMISCLVMLFARRAVGYTLKTDLRMMRNIPVFLLYALILVREIVLASITVIKLVFSSREKPDPIIVEFHSGLPSDFLNALLANSITLTPGTFTLIQEGDRFVVHCLRREFAEGIEDSVFVKILREVKQI